MIKVLILCGGKSPEHEISLRSARNVLAAIDTSKYAVSIIGIDHDGQWLHFESIPEGQYIEGGNPVSIDPSNRSISNASISIQPDVVFPVLHGPNGEDGSIQGLLQILDLPYVGPDVLGSSIAMDKDIAKIQLAAAGINVAKGVVLTSISQGNFRQIKAALGLPIFVKPANMGSSVGVHKVTNEDEFEKALKDAFQYDSKIVVEEMINGRELECAVLGLRDDLQVTMPGEVKAEEEYSFDEKYSESSQTQLDIPAKNLTETQITSLKKTALTAFKALNCEILSRVDMFLTDEGKIYVNEINTLPGFTSISMYPQLWEKEGLSYSDLISQLLELAVQRHARIKGLKKSRL